MSHDQVDNELAAFDDARLAYNQAGQGLTTLVRNIGKDSYERRGRPSYVENRIKELEESWRMFKDSSELLITFKLDSTGEAQVRSEVKARREEFERCKRELESRGFSKTQTREGLQLPLSSQVDPSAAQTAGGPTASLGASGGTGSGLEPIPIPKNQAATGAIRKGNPTNDATQRQASTRVEDSAQDSTTSQNSAKAEQGQMRQFLVRIEFFQDKLERFNRVRSPTGAHKKIMIEELNSSWAEVTQARCNLWLASLQSEASETLFNEIETRRCKCIESWSVDEERKEFRLPTLQIPSFNGDLRQWPNFSEAFKTLVSEAGAKPLECLFRLQHALVGEPKAEVEAKVLNGADFSSCWHYLETMYGNDRAIVSSQVRILFNLPVVDSKRPESIKALVGTVRNVIAALSSRNIDVSGWDPILNHLILEKLDMFSRRSFEEGLPNSKQIPTLEMIVTFLEQRYHILLAAADHKPSQSNFREFTGQRASKDQNGKPKSGTGKENVGKAEETKENKQEWKPECKKCLEPHNTYVCPTLKALTLSERLDFVQKNNLCQTCFKAKHPNQCRGYHFCRICASKGHATILHEFKEKGSVKVANTLAPINSVGEECVLGTASIRLKARSGELISARALFDTGSNVSLITGSLASRLRLKQEPSGVIVGGIGQTNSFCGAKVLLEIFHHADDEKAAAIKAHVLSSITKYRAKATQNLPKAWQELDLAETKFGEREINVLLGMDVISQILKPTILNDDGIFALETSLGFIVMGSRKKLVAVGTDLVSHVGCSEEKLSPADELDKRLGRIYGVEESGINDKDADVAAKHFKETTIRHSTGRFEVRLPFNGKEKSLGNSRSRALKFFNGWEKKMQASINQEQYEEYRQFVRNEIELGRLRVLTDVEIARPGFYTSHHGVKANGKALRVVNNFSMQSLTSDGKLGLTLNDCLLNGPALQRTIRFILSSWRTYKVAFTADIPAMYKQIAMNSADQLYQRMLFRDTPEKDLLTLVMTTVAFGAASSPSQAQACLMALADEIETEFPYIAWVIRNCFLVDDVCHGADDIYEVQRIIGQLMTVLARGGFPLAKFASNEKGALANLPAELKKPEMNVELPLVVTSEEQSEKTEVKTLGMSWDTQKDVLLFHVKQDDTLTDTRRQFASKAARLYDPLGFLTPCVMLLRRADQLMWPSEGEMDWDSPLPEESQKIFNTFKAEASCLEEIRIPRWLGSTKASPIEIHAFSDASKLAYGFAIYIKSEEGILLARSATRMTKKDETRTLPKLELEAAAMMCEVVSEMLEAFNGRMKRLRCYTDNSAVLGWIRGAKNVGIVFVRNRVAKILKVTKREQWAYVATANNPADMVTRGVTPRELLKKKTWWHGPSLLEEEYDETAAVLTALIGRQSFSGVEEYLERFGSYKQARNVTAFVLRFIDRIKSRKYGCSKEERRDWYAKLCKRGNDSLNTWAEEQNKDSNRTRIRFNLLYSERKNADKVLIKLSQEHNIPQILKECEKPVHLRRNIPTNFKRLILSKAEGIVWHRSIVYGQKMVVPRGKLADLMIKEAHKRTLCGSDNEVEHFFAWYVEIIEVNKIAKGIRKGCIECLRYLGKTYQQQMAVLPHLRTSPSYPFSRIAIDFAGPFMIKTTTLRNEKEVKVWICVIVCLSTKAVHLELAGDLSGNTVLAALARMIASRGHPSLIMSDNGTNFRYAARCITEMLKEQVKEAKEFFEERMVQWKFIPPAAPHFNGLAEATVKCVKRHLIPQITKSKLRYEELLTLIKVIEGILNSRPLCKYGEDMLTPGHFLIQRHLQQIPMPDVNEKEITPVENYKLICNRVNRFWNSWISEYLPNLERSYKWKKAHKNMKVDDIVIVKKDNLPPGKWPLARITEVQPGKDGLVRVVNIRTQCKADSVVYSARNLIVLPIAQDLVDQANYEQEVEKVIAGQDEAADSNEPVSQVSISQTVESDQGLRVYVVAQKVLSILRNPPIREEEETGVETRVETSSELKDLPRSGDSFKNTLWPALPVNEPPIPPPGMVFRKRPREWMRDVTTKIQRKN